jgi:plasmid segregation protein ParM
MTKNQNELSNLVIRALDVGYGYTKYSKEVDGKIVYQSFPSIAPRASKMESSDFAMLNQRETSIVAVDGIEYEIGPDSHLLETSESARSMNDQYVFSSQYKALVYGALDYMGDDVIDVLVVGLPVSTYNLYHDKVKTTLTGKHVINNSGKTVEIKTALVIPQPMGGLHFAMNNEILKELDLADSTFLIVDPGYLTLDFIVSNGQKIIEKRSGAHAGGVSRVIVAISESIEKKFKHKYDNLHAIDKGLRKRKIKISGKDEPLEEHIKNTKPVIEAPIIYMRNIVGDGSDIDTIILVGGGSKVFEKTLKEHYPNHTVTTVEESDLANVKGYQTIGEAYAKNQR